MIIMILLFIGGATWIAGIMEEAETKDTEKGESIRMAGIAIILITLIIAAVVGQFQ